MSLVPLGDLLRVARVAKRIDVLRELHPFAAPAALRLAMHAGLSVRTVHALHALNTPERAALVDSGGIRTYAEVDRAINRCAHALRDKLGIRRGDAVALAAENCAEYIITWFALMRLGARAVHASYRSTAAELEYLAGHAQVRAILVSDASFEAGDAVAQKRGIRVVAAGDRAAGAIRFDELLCRARSSELPEIGARHVGSESVVYTSGTTGRPKGAVRDFARFGVIEGARVMDRLPMRVGDRHLVVTPLYHSGAQAFTLMQSALGATIHLHAHFDPETTLETLSGEEIHSLFLVPTMIRRIVELPAEIRARFPTPELRALVSGASEFPDVLRRAAIAMFGASVVHDFYGATELGWVTLIDGNEMLARPGSVGRPLAGQSVAILDREGNELRTGEIGLVYVRNEQTMSGYLDDAAATDETRRGPWVTVEDLGRVDADGHLYISGRARDMVKSGGVNLYPVEIEEVIARHPSVREVAVIGLPDPTWGERLAAIVVPRGELDTADVERFVRTQLASVKVPKEWHVVDELPRNPTGKPLKRELRARYGG
ncbi:MAG: class I adenylate-forming enzyme family protein [Polyangiales bacterium]